MNRILNLISQNSANDEYVIGEALLEILPIDFIKPSEMGGASIRICGENNNQVETDFINAFKHIEELIFEDKIQVSQKVDKNIIGSFGIMLPRLSTPHVDRLISIPTVLDVWDVLSTHYSIR